ncbi:hypothetical protein DFJ67_5963 [Asanoa ferruginea]|uniref:Uncharacterized protein n=1 Tax=Asanoa ferruginea TaxID=53367 RepID=A0A3D9ZS09_9ACTN|nr:hypothetical protein [Asanoa ferruginea]REF99917.1 hypothetical protein DFJ67_5963 [Asanoa ferruginea]GIF51621.1 hypothetical protein Afe04nite_61600 [Asanoa ferruginea]
MRDGLWGSRLAWLLTFGGGIVLWGLLFGWGEDVLFGGGLAVLVSAGVSLLLYRRKAARGEVESEEDDVDWLARGSIAVWLAGSKRRYLATFTPTAPVVETADRHERRILETMRAVGMPPATLVPLDGEAPDDLDLVELPRRL